MRKKNVVVVDVGSSEIKVALAVEGIDGSPIIERFCSKQYSGFSSDGFFDENEFEDGLRLLVKELTLNSKLKFDRVLVGVPNAFLRIRRNKFHSELKRLKRINKSDVVALYKEGRRELDEGGYELISELPIYFGVNGKRVFNALGYHSSELGGYISYVFASKVFTDNVRRALEYKRKVKIGFIGEGYAEGLYYFGANYKTEPIIIADIGYITSSFTLLYGGGIVDEYSVDAGGGYVTASLLDKFSLSMEKAEELKRRLNVALSDDTKWKYRLFSDLGVGEFDGAEVNLVAKEAIDEAVGALDAFVERNEAKFQGNLKVCLTGGGISRIRGAIAHVSSRIGTDIELLVPDFAGQDKPERSVIASLTDIAIGEKYVY